MGQEIADSHFTAGDFDRFMVQVRNETALLEEWLVDGRCADGEAVGGFELEAWLVDAQARPVPRNPELLARLDDPLVVPELALFNLELNGTPQVLRGSALSHLADELRVTWSHCRREAAGIGVRLAMIGILPTVAAEHLTPAFMSPMQRYRALDEQLRRLRGGRPLQLSLSGRDRLSFSHPDVMLESATTSFQLHMKVGAQRAGRFYNASKIASAATVAVGANSPFLFGRQLWQETRIPLFEQSIQAGENEQARRVSFGVRYIDSIMDCFHANLERYPALLPQVMDEPPAALAHLRLHNGTIWRWNRPLVGFDADGTPHIRIEHRAVPAGPTVDDSIANAAFYFGLVSALAAMPEPPEQQLPFAQARRNFYEAAKLGLEATLHWLDGSSGNIVDGCREQLLPLARDGLSRLDIDRDEIEHWLGVIAGRLEQRQNGACWQVRWAARWGEDPAGLTEAYLERQESGKPVHEWTL